MGYGTTTPLHALQSDHVARDLLEHYLPGILRVEDAVLAPYTVLEDLVQRVRPAGEALPDLAPLWEALGALPDHPQAAQPNPAQASADYEDASVPLASARIIGPDAVERWGLVEWVLRGPSHGNPFIDVELSATVRCGDQRIDVGGFYDGDGAYRIRFMPPAEGTWTLETRSNARSLAGVVASVDVGAPSVGNHGPVRVRERFHFQYADGTAYLPFGTTAYAWTHQPQSRQEQTLAALTQTSFTKLRMCVFPKSFVYNAEEPELFPFERHGDGTWDFTRFSGPYFQNLDRRILQLQALEIEADIILFHPYDRWGFSVMPRWADELYTRYVVRRLGGYRNVWWSLANEYDFMRGKTGADWEAIAAVIVAEDHAHHLTSIHNGAVMFDHSRDWVTHCSIQRNNTDQTAHNVDDWRGFGKPVVVDEIGYEGDLAWGWGNLTARELVRRAWEGAVRGGYINHGETFHGDVVWWSHGGSLRGQSAARFAFLTDVVAAAPSGRWEPLASDFDAPWGGEADYRIVYFGAAQPARRTLTLPAGRWDIDLIDTWEMMIATLRHAAQGVVEIELPGRTDLAVRLRRSGPTA